MLFVLLILLLNQQDYFQLDCY